MYSEGTRGYFAKFHPFFAEDLDVYYFKNRGNLESLFNKMKELYLFAKELREENINNSKMQNVLEKKLIKLQIEHNSLLEKYETLKQRDYKNRAFKATMTRTNKMIKNLIT